MTDTAAVSSEASAPAPSLTQQFYEMLLESQWWSAGEIADYQRGQLEQLLRHARAQVPFYERRLDAIFRSNGEIAWERWRELPIVRRADMVSHRDAMQARELPPGHGPTGVLSTSGSTGQPLQVTVNALTGVANNGFRWRLHGWQGLDWSKVLLSRMERRAHGERWPNGESQKPWGPPWDAAARQGRIWRLSREFDSQHVLRVFKDIGATYLNAGPNMAHINALDARRLGIEVRIEAILVQGNVVRQADRDAVREVFGARMIEHYSSKEGGQMAHPCPLGNLHINAEGCLVEILDEAGEPCGPGQTGRAVITPFFLTGQPLIRYEQGDWATVGQPCSCGRHSPTIAGLKGRNVAIFHHPDGRSAASLMPDGVVTTMLGASYWQLAQVGSNTYEFRYVPVDDTVPGDEAAVGEVFRRTYFDDAQLRFVRVGSIPLTAGGKLVEYLNEWTLSGASGPA